MFTSTSSRTSSELFQGFLGDFYSRRLLLHTQLYQSTNPAAPPPVVGTPHDPSQPYAGDNSFDTNVIMVLSVLLCALICSLGFNSIIRCALRCSTLVASRSGANASARLANTGVKQKALKTFTIVNFSPDLKLPGLDTECVICLSEFASGDRIRLLPKCNHGFHVRCIDKWLSSHSSCPTCRHCLLETCQKIVASSSEPEAQPVQETIVSIAPLEPEGLIRNYREIS
ncbi:RING-H2 finger protein ATL78-like [Mangifera indica]|uniref:RING-H2 finger protein ATL78-like n=1 Tax=Mangifera indica TaxID=29780 RepID=UPI001CFB0580|nr:RING-H2 finger protein ATL78-like [Mangifera indica]